MREVSMVDHNEPRDAADFSQREKKPFNENL